jgi:probable F420-dependent oxidoreductase
MKFWLSLVSTLELDQMLELARFAEEVGFHGITVADHLVMSTRIESKYPYTEDGAIWWPDDTPWLDPWVTLSAMGAVTKNIKLASNIYLAALRDPFTAAKAVSTAAVLTNDRVVCGVSVGWIKEEYDLMNVEFATRGKRMDELIAVMRKLWTGKEVNHRGDFFDFERAIMCPAPRAPIPVWSGGGSKPALRRAALNDGWLGLPMTLAQLKPVAHTLKEIRRDAGLSPDNFDICFALAEPLTPAIADELRELRVNNMLAIAPWMPSPWDVTRCVDEGDDIRKLDVKKKALERYANSMLKNYAD